jgi:hypothetical protein
MILSLISSISCLLTSLLITFECQKYASITNTLKTPLQDVLHFSDFFLKYYNISDYVIGFYIISLILFFNNHIDVFLYQLSILYLIRSLSFSITLLPKCGKMADKSDNTGSFKILFQYITLKDTHTGHNNDLLFSGHSMFMLLYVLHLSKFYDIHILIKAILHIVSGSMSLLNIVSRCHYSVDILYAYITTIFIHQNTVDLLV